MMHIREVSVYLQDLLGLEFNEALTIPHVNAKVVAGKHKRSKKLEDLPGYREMLKENEWDMRLYEFCSKRLHTKLNEYRAMK